MEAPGRAGQVRSALEERPTLAIALAGATAGHKVFLDGEIVALDASGR